MQSTSMSPRTRRAALGVVLGILTVGTIGGCPLGVPTPPTETASFDIVVTSGGFNGGIGQALRFSDTGAFRGALPQTGRLTDPRDIIVRIPDPRSIATDGLPSEGEVLVVNGLDNVARFDFDGTALGNIVEPFETVNPVNDEVTPLNAGGMVIGPDGNLYLGGRSFAALLRFDIATGAFIDFFVEASADVAFPRGFVFSADGSLLFLGNGADPATGGGGGEIQAYDGTTGAPVDLAFVTDPELSPLDVILGLDDNIYVSSEFPFGSPDAVSTVRVYDSETGALLQVLDAGSDADGNPTMQAPRGMGFGPDGDLYVSSTGNGRVLRFDGDSGAFLGIAIEFPGLNGQALTFLPLGE